LLQKLHPEYYSAGILPTGNSSAEAAGTPQYYYANEKGKKILGIKYKTIEEISEDVLTDFKKRGWLERKYEPENEKKNMLV
jgi:hypothetical protein